MTFLLKRKKAGKNKDSPKEVDSSDEDRTKRTP